MGNTPSSPPGLSEAEAKAVRDNFRAAVAEAAHVTLADTSDNGLCIQVRVSEEAAKKGAEQLIWGYPPDKRPHPKAHILLVTHALSWIHGTEMTARLKADASNETVDQMCAALSQFTSMQKEGLKFQFFESTEDMAWSWAIREGGDKGALLLPDPVLKGGTWHPVYVKMPWDDEDPVKHLMSKDSANAPPHVDFWPRHFVTVAMMHPCEYAQSTSLPPRVLANLLGLHLKEPFFITDPSRTCLVHNEEFKRDLDAIAGSIPTNAAADGLSLDLRLRRRNTALDVVLSPRCLAHLLIPMEQAFKKNPVPKGSFVRGISEGGQCDIEFSAHHPETKEPIRDGEGFWEVNFVLYGTDGSTLVKVPEALSKALSEVPQGPLYDEHNLIRMIKVTVFMPAPTLASMLSDVRLAIDGTPGRDWERDPLLLEWPEAFASGKQATYSKTCFNKEVSASECTSNKPATAGTTKPLTFRFGAAGMNYFEDESVIDEDGQFVEANSYTQPPDLPEVPTEFEVLGGSSNTSEDSSTGSEEV